LQLQQIINGLQILLQQSLFCLLGFFGIEQQDFLHCSVSNEGEAIVKDGENVKNKM
jgi:hypothetical protein